MEFYKYQPLYLPTDISEYTWTTLHDPQVKHSNFVLYILSYTVLTFFRVPTPPLPVGSIYHWLFVNSVILILKFNSNQQYSLPLATTCAVSFQAIPETQILLLLVLLFHFQCQPASFLARLQRSKTHDNRSVNNSRRDLSGILIVLVIALPFIRFRVALHLRAAP